MRLNRSASRLRGSHGGSRAAAMLSAMYPPAGPIRACPASTPDGDDGQSLARKNQPAQPSPKRSFADDSLRTRAAWPAPIKSPSWRLEAGKFADIPFRRALALWRACCRGSWVRRFVPCRAVSIPAIWSLSFREIISIQVLQFKIRPNFSDDSNKLFCSRRKVTRLI